MTAIPDEAWCPTCRAVSLTHKHGLCVWCDTRIATGTAVRPAAGANANRGYPILMGEDTLARARDLYATGLGLRRVATQLIGETAYASVRSMAESLRAQFRHRGWEIRSRADGVVAFNFRHGRARRHSVDPTYRRDGKIRRGEIRGVMCTATCSQHPRKGQPCTKPALAGGVFCVSHDPARAEWREANLARARALRVVGVS